MITKERSNLNNGSNKVIIVSYFFYPENKPRAFRTFELAKGLAKSGYKVEVVIPTYSLDGVLMTFDDLSSKYPSLSIRTVGNVRKNIEQNKKALPKSKSTKLPSGIMMWFKRLAYFVFPSGKDFIYGWKLIHFFRKNRSSADTVISISYPYSVHIGTIVARKFGFLKVNKVLTEFGDTLVGCPALPNSFIHKWIQQFISKNTNIIVTPTENSIPNFTLYKSKESVKVIPQGYDFSDTRTKNYTKNPVPTFGYAGSFHATARNPKIFLQYLSTLDFEFKFIVYSNIKDPDLVSIFDEYQAKLTHKLEIRGLIPRLDVIETMSTFDFLIFEENLSENQNPSKIVDYKLSGRPIFSFSQDHLNQTKFLEFINDDYSNADFDKFSISDYSIDNVVDKFIDLLISEN